MWQMKTKQQNLKTHVQGVQYAGRAEKIGFAR